MSTSDSALDAFVSRVRRDAYTGANRCWPCTVLNVGLLACLTAVTSVLLTPLSGFVAVAVGLAAIWLRGYLVPYTPQLTPTLLAALPGRAAPWIGSYGSSDGRRVGGDVSGDADVDGETDAVEGENSDAAAGMIDELLAAGVLSEDERGLSLRPAFRERWRSEMVEARANGREELAAALREAVPWVAEASAATEDDRYWIVLEDEEGRIANETWLAPPAAVADLAALRALAARTEFGPTRRTLAAPPLRQFLDRCPACDSTLEVTSPHTCCGSPRSVAEGIESVLSCPSCDEIVTAFRTPEDEPT